MKKLFLVLFSTFLFQISFGQQFCGFYSKEGKHDLHYYLYLNKDSSFLLKIYYQDARPECSGKWTMCGADTILIVCDEIKDLMEIVTNGYMQKRQRKVLVLSEKKLQLDNVVLKKRRKQSE